MSTFISSILLNISFKIKSNEHIWNMMSGVDETDADVGKRLENTGFDQNHIPQASFCH